MTSGQQRRLRDVLLGPPRDPLAPETRKHIALVAFLAWIGIGADGLSSSAYGPAEAFIALGSHSQLALYLAFATAFTVFVISLAYNQVIELFPNGGGGYKVATRLVGPYAGLVAGSALIVDYVLTIAISAASGIDALFSLLPPAHQIVKLEAAVAVVMLLIYLNLRGMRESITLLAPIFIGFCLTHFALIVYGIWSHQDGLVAEVQATVQETQSLAGEIGWFFVLALFLKAYSLGGGTYTGIEAVSNNVNMLKEPRVRTGKWTMFLMALSLSVTAGGIILLYLLWDVEPSHTGQTLNAVVFGDIIHSIGFDAITSHTMLVVVLFFEGALLFVAANTGFLGGPAVLANMAVDRWVPNQFSALSSRLVTRNGVLLMGAAALAILVWTEGHVALLVVLYTVNVFITFALSLLGLTFYWWKQRRDVPDARRKFVLAAFALVIVLAILAVIVVERFLQGGIVTLAITSSVVALGLLIRRHYSRIRALTLAFERGKRWRMHELPLGAPSLQPGEPTAVFLVSANRGLGLHTIERVEALFPAHFRNFVFVSVGTVDSESYGSEQSLRTLQYETRAVLDALVNYAHCHGKGAAWFDDYGADRLQALERLALEVREQFPHSVFFANRLVFEHDSWWTRWLHSQTPLAVQRALNLHGIELVILPVRIEAGLTAGGGPAGPLATPA
ncbi:MAG TPA: APC family permease [Steroidobacteraceae bacterium]|nr:APC family permease [Steroidobacteraceae bacterium]